jgi:outer membrane lipoprotein LolB
VTAAPPTRRCCPRSPQRRHVGAYFAAAAALTLIPGCASYAPLPATAVTDVLSGRLAIRIDATGSEPPRAFSAAFDLRGDSRDGTLALSTPLGSTLAQARWLPGQVSLVTPQGRREFAGLDELTREVLGESVPVEAWFDWLRGRPWSGAASQGDSPPGFEQLGWRVDLSRFAAGNVVASRLQPAPAVTVRIQLEAS